MEEIVERLGREKLLFVTHVNAKTPDGEVILARDRLIRWVKLAGEQLGVRVFDPTAALTEFGQERALDDRGLDLTHYTGAFSDRLYDALHREYVAPLLGSQSQSAGDDRTRHVAAIAARIESEIELGDFFEGSRELHRAIELFPDAPRLVQLRGLIRARIGDFHGAVEDFSRCCEDRTVSTDVRMALVEALSEAGDYEASLRAAQALMTEELEDVALYRLAEEAAKQVGRDDLAIAYAKQAYRLDRRDLSSALRALVLMSDRSAADQIADWRNEILENVGAAANGAFEICLWAVRHGDEELFAAPLEVVVASDKVGGIDLMEEALNAGLHRAVAASIPVAAKLGKISRSLAERRARLIVGALERAREIAESGDLPTAYQIAEAIEELHDAPIDQLPVSRLATYAQRLIKALVAKVRTAVRSAYVAGDLPAVIEVAQRAGDILRHDGTSTTLVARALQATGDPKSGLALLTGLNPAERDQFTVRRWTARLAAAVQDYTVALEIYGSLREAKDADAAKLKPEIDRFFASAQARSHRQLNLFAREGKIEDAVRLAHAIDKYIGPHERTERELGRMHKQMRLQLRQIEEGDGMIEDRESVLRQMVLIRPEDVISLRRLAIELMRQFRFAEAAEYWEKICALDSQNESADRNRVRCATLAQRRTSASVQLADAAA
jgi:tetratricopeptide (TPR) repeat protein